jgi:hypothetical protein
MIGGCDIVFETSANAQDAMTVILGVIRRAWPQAVVEDADGRWRAPPGDAVPGDAAEVLVYRDASAVERWGDLGAAPELANTMIHVLAADGEATLVLGDPSTAEMRSMISDLSSAAEAMWRAD